MHTFNGIPPLLELLSSEFPIIQQFALRTLETINKDRDSRTAFREQNGFAQILEFLTKKVSLWTINYVFKNNHCLFCCITGMAISSYCVSWNVLHHLSIQVTCHFYQINSIPIHSDPFLKSHPSQYSGSFHNWTLTLALLFNMALNNSYWKTEAVDRFCDLYDLYSNRVHLAYHSTTNVNSVIAFLIYNHKKTVFFTVFLFCWCYKSPCQSW